MASTTEAIVRSLITSIDTAQRADQPYKYWFMRNCLPQAEAEEIINLPFPAPDLGGVSGKREIHNATRRYFDQGNMDKFPVVKAFNEAMTSRQVISHIEQVFGTQLTGSYLRVEYAQDTGGFWLEPHTDLGVKLFTMLLYMSKDEQHKTLGTDIYDTSHKHVARSPWESNGALVFVPSNITFHGFEKRDIIGIRKSVIINFVTNDWRAREQLAYPDKPVA